MVGETYCVLHSQKSFKSSPFEGIECIAEGGMQGG